VSQFFPCTASPSTLTTLATMKKEACGFLHSIGTFDRYMVHKPK
jgi:hypothetical protein